MMICIYTLLSLCTVWAKLVVWTELVVQQELFHFLHSCCWWMNTEKLKFYNPRFYPFHEFRHFLHCPGQIPITLMLNNRFYVSTTSSFPQIFHFIYLVLTIKIYPILCFVVQFSRVSYSRQLISFPVNKQSQMVQSENIYSLMHSCDSHAPRAFTSLLHI